MNTNPERSGHPPGPEADAAATSDAPAASQAASGSEVQGEGDYDAARRHRASAERFVQSGQVEAAAEAAEPSGEAEARELRDAEAEGRAHARG